jgi:hypothetical protein
MNSELVYIPGWGQPVINAVEWLRKYKNITDYETIEEQFTEYFNCEIYREMMDPPFERIPARVYAVFTERNAVEFLLKWS